MVKRKASVLLIASALLMLPAAASAQSGNGGGVTPTTASKGGAVTASSLMERYGTLAGSPENAKSLVNGLRAKDWVTLTGPVVMPTPCKFPCKNPGSNTVTIKFMPHTDGMGFGNVDVALALLEAELAAKNATPAKPEMIRAALQGGTVRTPTGDVAFDGILKLRADGKGWGEIAKTLGFELR